jgi:hypothetical protein
VAERVDPCSRLSEGVRSAPWRRKGLAGAARAGATELDPTDRLTPVGAWLIEVHRLYGPTAGFNE